MELQFDEYGSGEAVLLVHGLGGTSNVWGAQAVALSRFYRVIILDLRGAGRSAARTGINVPTMVDDLVELTDRRRRRNLAASRRARDCGSYLWRIVFNRLALRPLDAD
jgi:pimeloyl-ACP methyl ester carboxylesterase